MSLITKWIKKKKVDDVLSRKLTTDKESQFRESIQSPVKLELGGK